MPKLKPSPIAEAGETVMRNICAQGAICGALTDKEIARKMGVPASTFSTWRNTPTRIGIKGLVMASLAFKCSLAWLVTDHKGEYKDEA